MTRKKLETWLNRQIELRKKLEKGDDLTETIRAVSSVSSKDLHIYKGLGTIAELLGAELFVNDRGPEGGKYRYERYFWYNGVKVFAIYETLEGDINE